MNNYLRAIVQAAIRMTNLEQLSQSNHLRAIVLLEEETLGLKEAVFVLENRTD